MRGMMRRLQRQWNVQTHIAHDNKNSSLNDGRDNMPGPRALSRLQHTSILISFNNTHLLPARQMLLSLRERRTALTHNEARYNEKCKRTKSTKTVISLKETTSTLQENLSSESSHPAAATLLHSLMSRTNVVLDQDDDNGCGRCIPTTGSPGIYREKLLCVVYTE